MSTGIMFAFLALLGWGVADFLIEKSTRKIGDTASLFFITAFGAVVLLPFVYKDIWPLVSLQNGSSDFWILMLAGIFGLIASLLDFESLRIGKISIVEPIYAIEVIGTIVVTGILIGEWLSLTQTLLVLAIIVGVVLVSLKQLSFFKKFHLERGVLYALTASLFMIGENFFTGYGSRVTNPLLANWVIDIIIATCTFAYLLKTKQANRLITQVKQNPKLIFWVSSFDTVGWVAFSYSAIYIPIGLATGISEAYIALAALLGLLINREKLRPHQFSGLALTIFAAIILSCLN